jgi:hypothetical protein
MATRRNFGRRMLSTTVYLDPPQLDLLKVLAQRLRVPMARLVRQGIDMYLDQERRAKGTPGGQVGIR